MGNQNISLKYRMGEVTLWTLSLNMSVDQHHFSKRTGQDLFIPDRDVEGDGCFYESYPIDRELRKISLKDGYVRYVPKQYHRYYIDLNVGMEGYLGKFSSKSRSTLRRKINKFKKTAGGDITWRCYQTAEEIKEFFPLARGVSETTYQEKLLDAGLPDTSDFFKESIQLANDGSVLGYILFLDGKPIAYLFCPVEEGVLFYQYLGYDPEYSKLSPGTVLQWLVLEDLLSRRKYKIFDFTQGEGAHKAFFSNGSQLCADIYFFKISTVNLSRVYLHAGVDAVSDFIVKVIEKTGLKSQVKKFFRRLR